MSSRLEGSSSRRRVDDGSGGLVRLPPSPSGVVMSGVGHGYVYVWTPGFLSRWVGSKRRGPQTRVIRSDSLVRQYRW